MGVSPRYTERHVIHPTRLTEPQGKIKKHGKRILPCVVCLVFGCIIGGYSDTPLPLLSLLVATGAFVFFGRELAVYLLLIALPFSFRYILPGRFEIQTPTEPLLGMLAAVYCGQRILDRALRKDKPENTFPFLVPLCLYILVTFLSAINTPDLFGTLKGALRATVYMLFSVVVHATLQNRTALKRLFIASFPSAAVAVIWTVIVLIYHIDAWQWTSAYRSAPFTNYSVYGAFTALFFLVCLSRLLFDNSRYDRVLWTAWFLCFGVGLLMCFSRGVWLSVIVAIGFMLLQLGKGVTHKKILFIGATCLILLVCLNLPGIYNIIVERITSAMDLSYASNRARLLRWGQAFVMFAESPILGKGYGCVCNVVRGRCRTCWKLHGTVPTRGTQRIPSSYGGIGNRRIRDMDLAEPCLPTLRFLFTQNVRRRFLPCHCHWIDGSRNFIDGAFHSEQPTEW